MARHALRPATSTSSFQYLTFGPAVASSPPPATAAGPCSRPTLRRLWCLALPTVAALDLLTSIGLALWINDKDVLLLVGWACVRAAAAGWVGKGLATGAGAGTGWISVNSTISVLLVLWQLNLLFQTRSRTHGAHEPPLLPAGSTLLCNALWTTDAAVTTSIIGRKAHQALSAHYILLAATTSFALSEEAIGFMATRKLPHRRRPFALHHPRQTPVFVSFSLTSTEGALYDENFETSSLSSLEDLNHGEESESFESDLSESEIVDIAPSFPSSRSLATSSTHSDRLARSLSRSFLRRQVRAGHGEGAATTGNLRESREGYGTFLDDDLWEGTPFKTTSNAM